MWMNLRRTSAYENRKQNHEKGKKGVQKSEFENGWRQDFNVNICFCTIELWFYTTKL